MNKAGQLGIISFVFLLILFMIIWAVWLGGYINAQAQQWIATAGATGLEAFLIANLNLWIFLILLIVIVWAMFGGSR